MGLHNRKTITIGLIIFAFLQVAEARVAIPREGNRPLQSLQKIEDNEDYSLNDSFSELGGEPVDRRSLKRRRVRKSVTPEPQFSPLTAAGESDVVSDAPSAVAPSPGTSTYFKKETSVKKSPGKKVTKQKTTKRIVKRSVKKKAGNDPVVKNLETDIQGDYYEPLSDSDFQPAASPTPKASEDDKVEPANLD